MTVQRTTDFYVIAPLATAPQSYCLSRDEAERRLAYLTEEDPTKWTGGRIVSCDEYFAEREASYLSKPALEITEDAYHDALNILPPIGWTTADGVERFCMSEFTSGKITTQFATRGDRFMCRHVRWGDRSTYITAADFDRLS